MEKERLNLSRPVELLRRQSLRILAVFERPLDDRSNTNLVKKDFHACDAHNGHQNQRRNPIGLARDVLKCLAWGKEDAHQSGAQGLRGLRHFRRCASRTHNRLLLARVSLICDSVSTGKTPSKIAGRAAIRNRALGFGRGSRNSTRTLYGWALAAMAIASSTARCDDARHRHHETPSNNDQSARRLHCE